MQSSSQMRLLGQTDLNHNLMNALKFYELFKKNYALYVTYAIEISLIFFRSQIGIKAGEEITTQYLSPMMATMERRQKIR